MIVSKNNVLNRKNNKPILWDGYYNDTKVSKPLVIFCHGYKGYKDWGAWDIVAKTFAKANLFFVKFNFSHNGGTIENPIDFPDLDAFAENNYTKELNDLDSILNFLLSTTNPYLNQIDINNITLIGHSRGGGISIIKTAEDYRVTKLITWASICDFAKLTAKVGDLKTWQNEGVKYVLNGRTKQQLPHNYQFYEDFKANEARLNIENSSKKIKRPFLIIHAKEDPSVKYEEAEHLHKWNANSILLAVDNSDHVFGTKHPWQAEELTEALDLVTNTSIHFIKKEAII